MESNHLNWSNLRRETIANPLPHTLPHYAKFKFDKQPRHYAKNLGNFYLGLPANISRIRRKTNIKQKNVPFDMKISAFVEFG